MSTRGRAYIKSVEKAPAQVLVLPKAHPVLNLPKVTQAVLESTITTGLFIDCQFKLYSRRLTSNGAVHTPRIVYAHSEVLKHTTDHFQSLLCGGFAEGRGTSGGSTEMPSQIAANEYGYESDSDLEDDDDSTPAFICPSTEAFSTANGGAQSALQANGVLKDAGGSPSGVTPNSLAEGSMHSDMRPDLPVRSGNVVIIPDTAFKTFKALVCYAYTGQIHFANLRSARDAAKDSPCSPAPSEMACSPKSMYRLADKYGLTTLKDLAAKSICSQLSRKNALHETLSRFTSNYTEIISLETAFIYESDTRLDCLWDLELWTHRVVSGELAHAGEALATLIRKLASRP
ncbi:hypothetical protein BC628DRAFT_1053107 [Trametes gibbosa]|nr:hypothetical protein BC628DRAFT_1053107 [Trametes gibbosa]